MDENITLAQLRQMPLHEAIDLLNPQYVPAHRKRIGPFGNVSLRPMIFPKVGAVVNVHTHNFDHALFIALGGLSVWAQEVDESQTDIADINETEEQLIARLQRPRRIVYIGDPVERQFEAPSVVLIKRNWAHKITALKEPTWATCIFAMRDAKGELSEFWDGNQEHWK